jgi:hypothetical protein
MKAFEILVRANSLGITLAAQGSYLVARPKGATPPDLAQGIRNHKPELLTLLARPHPEPYHLRNRDEDDIDRGV